MDYWSFRTLEKICDTVVRVVSCIAEKLANKKEDKK